MHSVGARIYLHIFVETAGQQSLFQGLMVSVVQLIVVSLGLYPMY